MPGKTSDFMHGGLTLRFLSFISLSIWCLFAGSFSLATAQASEVDWSAWESVPVLDRGRLMPLDTFARNVVRDICGKEKPKLSPPMHPEALPPQIRAAVERLFPDGKTRKFSAAELLYCWTAEPEVWEYIPFLSASNETFREKNLEVPLLAPSGDRLKYVSPLDFQQAESNIFEMHSDLHARQREAKRESRELATKREDEALLELITAYNLYRSIIFNPDFNDRIDQEFQTHFVNVIETWRGLAPNLAPWMEDDVSDDELTIVVKQVGDSVKNLSKQFRSQETQLAQLAMTASELADASGKLAAHIEALRTQVFEAKEVEKDKAFLQKGREMMNLLAAKTSQLAKDAHLLEVSVYDEGRSLRVLPALNRWALGNERDASTVAPPWINLQTLLYAPDSVLRRFPSGQVISVREAFEASQRAYREIEVSNADAQKTSVLSFEASLQDFNKKLRSFGETLNFERKKIKIHEPDEKLLAETAYPPVGAFDVELRYNRIDPFLWAWVLTLVAVIFFALALGYLRTPMVVVAVVFLTLGQLATCYGLGLRMMITKMVPVTNMFETILFVGATAGILTICHAIFPIIQLGLSTAWRLTAWPSGAEARSLDEPQLRVAGFLGSSNFRWLLFAIRVGLIVTILYFLAFIQFSPDGKQSILDLFLSTVKDKNVGGMLGAIVLWIVGGSLFVWAIWFFPRAVPATVLALILIPISWFRFGFRDGLHQTVDRRLYLIGGSIVALLIYLVGYWTPHTTFSRDVGMGMAPALRNNFWLAIHVLVITASYGAGALAWGIGNISAAFHLFGRYTADKPPAIAHTLANYIYRMMQIAVLLLAAGTITGAIWADFAWGRYWGWDPKEVWALITLFVYLAILHGRWARWIGDFGMAIGAVIGFTSIIIAWYGVNFIGRGLHSYGSIKGGFLWVAIIVAINWIFVFAVLIRYLVQQGLAETKEVEEMESDR